MQIPRKSIIQTGSGADIAFALVVLASYFITFSNLVRTELFDVALMISLGTAYIIMGIYGYKISAGSNHSLAQILYFFIQIPLGSIIVYLGKGVGFNAMLLLPLAAHSVVLLTPPWMIAANIILDLSYFFTAISSNDVQSFWSVFPTFLAGQVFIVFFTQMAVSEENARSEVERLVHELADANQQLREYAVQIEELTLTKERNRLAREIHDGLGHYLTTMHMQIQAARAVMSRDQSKALDAMTKAQEIAQEALVEIRKSVASLRGAEEESLPLNISIAKLIKSFENSGIDIKLEVYGMFRPVSPQAQLTIFRTVQEGLNNACKHAHASKILIKLNYSDPDMVSLSIYDNGIGSETTDGGFGLIGIQERLNLLNGKFRIESKVGQGFLVEIGIPE